MFISRELGVRYSNNQERYLGLSNAMGRRKKASFQILKDQIKLKIRGWSTRLLSQGIKLKIDGWSTRLLSQGGKEGHKTGANGVDYGRKLLNYSDSLLARVLKKFREFGILHLEKYLAQGNYYRKHNVSLVAKLIDNVNRKWRRETITNTFSGIDATRILQIPLAKETYDDVMAWGGEPSGEFSVHSAYKLLQTCISTPISFLEISIGGYGA
ncbi:Alanyl-tRNA synthetase [Gossypium australe]|uniref:Alanyl-tRNA synthetase n=1 Tax=Gossypium australe TaxID=47621 RepID=A0A5B6WQ67_9ROSI|nr:Alanyl-tRNA synthetase [Gossypium australe]